MYRPALQKRDKSKFLPGLRRRFSAFVDFWLRDSWNEPDYVREVVHDAPFSICSMDGPEMRITFANESFRDLIGTKRPLVGRLMRMALEKQMPACFFDLVERVFKNGETEEAHEILAHFTDGAGKPFTRYLDFECRPKMGREGSVSGVIFLAIDVTSKVRARQSAERRVASLQSEVSTRDEFFSIASHELKSPITSLKLQLQVTQKRLAKTLKDAQEVEALSKALDRSTDQVDRLGDLVDDLMDVTRIANGKLNFHFEYQNVSDILNETVRGYEHQLTANQCPLTMKIQPDLHANVDRLRLEQVIVNLISNAIKHAPGAALEIEATGDADQIEFSFRDDGPGIPEASQKRIFERFGRVRPKAATPGLGLGLFIVCQIVQGHGGTIALESSEGRGAKFTIRLPKRAQ